MSKKFKQYRRKQIAELREVTAQDLKEYAIHKCIVAFNNKDAPLTVSISDSDIKNGSPKFGDMIARNPKNHLDQWLVAEKYFNDNFEEL